MGRCRGGRDRTPAAVGRGRKLESVANQQLNCFNWSGKWKIPVFLLPPLPRIAVVSVLATCEGWLKNGARHLKTIPELHQNKPAHDFQPGWEIKFVFAVYYRRVIRRKDLLRAWRTSMPQPPGLYLWNLRRVHFPTEEDGKTEDFFGDNLSGALNANKKIKMSR